MDLILGHNQFLGISHISDERGREREEKFSDIKNIYNIVEKAADLGYKGMILETHPRMLEFIEYYKKNKTFEIEFYLQLPNIQGYIQKMNEQGLKGLILQIVKQGGLKTTSTSILKNIVSYIKKDYISIGISFLPFEIEPFKDLEIKAVLLHNVITDLLLSLRMSNALQEFSSFVEEKMGMKSGFITLNFELFKTTFEEKNSHPLVMTPINSGGYDMNPSFQVVETSLKRYKGDIIAMNVLGGGAFSLRNSIQYLKSFENIKYCVIGASTNKHLIEFKEIFNGKI